MPPEHGADRDRQITPKTAVSMSMLQFFALLVAVVGSAYWIGAKGVTKEDLNVRTAPIESKLDKVESKIDQVEQSMQDIRTTLAVLKDRSDRDQKKPTP